MNKIPAILIFAFLFAGCQSEFNSRDQAKNRVNNEGYRIGRWIDYLDSDEKRTLYISKADFYLLSEYRDGKPTDGYRIYNRSDEILRMGPFEKDTILYDKFNIPKTSQIGTTVFFSNNKMIQKQIIDDNLLPIKTIDYFYYSSSNVDSFIVDWAYYPSGQTRTIAFSNTGKSRIVIQYDEYQWVDYIDISIFNRLLEDQNFPDGFIDEYVKGKFPTATLNLFKEVVSDEYLLRMNSINNGTLTLDLKKSLQKNLIEHNKNITEYNLPSSLWYRIHFLKTYDEMSVWIKRWEPLFTHDLIGAGIYKNRVDIERRKNDVIKCYFEGDSLSFRRRLRDIAEENDYTDEEVYIVLNELDLAIKRIRTVSQSI